MRIGIAILLVLVVSLGRASSAAGQSFGGQAVDGRSGAPLAGLDVRLLQHRDGLAVPAIVDSMKTDDRGLFEFRVSPGGVYQAEFGPWASPYSLGTIDTVGNGRLLRRYLVPVPAPLEPTPDSIARRPPAAASMTARPPVGDSALRGPAAAVPVRLPIQPRMLRVGAMTALGTVLGGAAGFIVAEQRCGRTRDCDAAVSYPYYPGGAAIGAALGSGITASDAGCPLGFARGVAGSLLGSLAGSLVSGEGVRRTHAGAALGAPIGSALLVATCRLGARGRRSAHG